MSLIRVTKEFTFEMAHALLGYDGSCRYVHGHSYGLSVTVAGKPITDKENPKLGMVIDFGDLKKVVKEMVVDKFDHALVLNKKTPLSHIKDTDEMFDKLMLVDYQPTSENIIFDFAKRISRKLPDEVELYNLKLRETATSFVEWFAIENK